jgi:hypothetical protein
MTKNLFIEMRVNQCLVEAKGYDLIAMGQARRVPAAIAPQTIF